MAYPYTFTPFRLTIGDLTIDGQTFGSVEGLKALVTVAAALVAEPNAEQHVPLSDAAFLKLDAHGRARALQDALGLLRLNAAQRATQLVAADSIERDAAPLLLALTDLLAALARMP